MTMHWRRIARGTGTVTLVVFLLCTLTPTPNLVGSWIAIEGQPAPADAIVVLAAGLYRDGTLHDESMRRLIRGLDLFHSRLAPRIVLSGPLRADVDLSEAEVRSRIAQSFHVPPSAIIKIEATNNTYDEAVQTTHVLKDLNVRRILLVTESIHLRRSMLLFENQGYEVVPVAHDRYAYNLSRTQDRLWLTYRIAQECVALLYYKVAGYI